MWFIIASGGLLNIDVGPFLWELIAFIIFVIILGKFAWRPMLNALHERENWIQSSIDTAERALEKAEKISKENEAALHEAEIMAQRIRKEAVEEARLVRAERLERVKKEADELIERARNAIEQERKRAFLELRKEVAELAIQAASVILDAELDAEKNRRLVDNFLEDFSGDYVRS